MNHEKPEELDSELGKIEIHNSFLRRRRTRDSRWDIITEIFEADELADHVAFSELEDLELDPEKPLPNIVLDLGTTRKRIFLSAADNPQQIFDRIKYRWQAHLQNR
ncbi:MAG: hypothetical protein ABEJ98_05470 [Candidatus Nanohaloarchaea archaeon]